MTFRTCETINAQDTICLFHYSISHDWQLQSESTRGNITKHILSDIIQIITKMLQNNML